MVRIKLLIALLFCSVIAFGQLPQRSGLVGYWKFEETSGTTAYDETSNDNDGTIVSATINQTGKVGKCYDYDGSNDYIDIDSHASNFEGYANGTLSFWFKINSSPQNTICALNISDISSSVASMNILFGPATGTYSDESILFAVGTPGVWRLLAFVRNGHYYYHDNTWHHCAVVIDGTANKIYIDGISQTLTWLAGGATSSYFTNIGATANTFKVGSRHFNSGGTTYHDLYFDGNLDEVMIHSRASSELEIKQLYNSGDGLLYVYENYLNDNDFEKFNNYARAYFAQKLN